MAHIQTIIISEGKAGDGQSIDNPYRNITQYWTLGGELLCGIDKWADEYSKKRIAELEHEIAELNTKLENIKFNRSQEADNEKHT